MHMTRIYSLNCFLLVLLVSVQGLININAKKLNLKCLNLPIKSVNKIPRSQGLSTLHNSRISFQLFAIDDENTGDGENDQKASKKSTKFDRTIDDFIGKRYGAGEKFYGKRLSDLSEDTYSEIKSANKPKTFDGPAKDNAILIFGSLESMGQFVAFELAEKGFNLRIATNNIKTAISCFGLPGNNVDIFELKKESSLDAYLKTLNGVQAIILTGNFDPTINPLIGSCRDYNEVAMKLLDIAREGQRTKTLAVQKIIHISRVQEAKIKSPFDFLYTEFYNIGHELEEYVRASKIEYVIVRAPQEVELSREGGVRDLLVTQGSTTPDTSTPSLIGVLDLAECATQALLLDTTTGLTFTVSEEDTNSDTINDEPIVNSKAMEEQYGISTKKEIPSNRISRRAYYSILEMDDSDMRSSYMIKPQEAYIAQIEEDRLLEKYWALKFAQLKKD